jgi:hypothetical protein
MQRVGLPIIAIVFVFAACQKSSDKVASRSMAHIIYDTPQITDAPIVTGMFGAKHNVNAAFDGTNFLVSWQTSELIHAHAYGARVATDGTLVDPLPAQYSSSGLSRHGPILAFNGKDYLLVTESLGLPGSTRSIYARRISTAGVPIDNEVVIGEGGAEENNVSVASTGDGFLVAWTDLIGGTDRQVLHRFVDGNGSAIGTQATMLADMADTATTVALRPQIAANADRYLVVWKDLLGAGQIGARAMRIAADGSALDPAPVDLETGATMGEAGIDVAFNGNHFLAVWGRHTDFGATRITPAGQILDAPFLNLPTTANGANDPHLVTIGDTFYVVHSDVGATVSLFSMRVANDGSVVDGAGGIALINNIPSSDYSMNKLAVAAGTDRYFVGWESESDTAELPGIRVSAQQVVLDTPPLSLSKATNSQGSPALAYAVTGGLLVFDDNRSGTTRDVYAQRVDMLGSPVGGPFLVAGGAGNQSLPRIATDGDQYLVAWTTQPPGGTGAVSGVRISQAGTVLDIPAIDIESASSHSSVEVASNGQDFIVFYTTGASPGSLTIGARRLNAAGSVLDPADIHVLTQNSAYQHLRAASDGTDYLLGWADAGGGSDEIFAARVTNAGTVLDPEGFSLGPALSLIDDATYPAVAHGANTYLVAWSQATAPGQGEIVGRRVASDGSVAAPAAFAVGNSSGFALMPSVVFDGANFIAAWGDIPAPLVSFPGIIDIRATRISPSGTVADTTGELVGAIAGAGQTAMATLNVDDVAFVVRAHDDDPDTISERLGLSRFRFTTNPPDAGIDSGPIVDASVDTTVPDGAVDATVDALIDASVDAIIADTSSDVVLTTVDSNVADSAPPPQKDAGAPDALVDAAVVSDVAVDLSGEVDQSSADIHAADSTAMDAGDPYLVDDAGREYRIDDAGNRLYLHDSGTGGTDGGGLPGDTDGCDCRMSSRGAPNLWVWSLVLLVFWRRRKGPSRTNRSL